MTRPTDGRHPGGHGRRTGELKATRKLDPKSAAAQRRLKVLRDPLWEIQAGETTLAYQRFRVYRDLGPSRTHKRVAEIEGRAHQQISDLSAKYRWVERVQAYDAYLETVLLGRQEAAIREASRSWVARQDEIRQAEYEVAMALVDKVREMLKHPITEVRRNRVYIERPKWVWLTTIVPARWDWKSAADILTKVAFQARLSADMVTDGARSPTPDLTDRGVSDIDAWLEELGVSAEINDREAREERER